jgi:hypothetical protein
MRHTVKILTVALFIQILSHFLITVKAQNYVVRSKFYAGMDAGIGLLNLARNDLTSQRSNTFALGFYGGYMPFKWLRTGINISGWLIESYGNFYDDPSKGISISNTYLQVQAFPFNKFDFFINFAGGISGYINHHMDEYNAKGSGIITGVGYERKLAGNVGISLMINYGFGQFNDVNYPGISVKNQHYDVTEFLIGFTYHFVPKNHLPYQKEKIRSLEEPELKSTL